MVKSGSAFGHAFGHGPLGEVIDVSMQGAKFSARNCLPSAPNASNALSRSYKCKDGDLSPHVLERCTVGRFSCVVAAMAPLDHRRYTSFSAYGIMEFQAEAFEQHVNNMSAHVGTVSTCHQTVPAN